MTSPADDPDDMHAPILSNSGCLLEPDAEDMVCVDKDVPLGLLFALAGTSQDLLLFAAQTLQANYTKIPVDEEETRAHARIALLAYQEHIAFLARFDTIKLGDAVYLDRADRNELRKMCHVFLSSAIPDPTRFAESLLAMIGPWYEDVDDWTATALPADPDER